MALSTNVQTDITFKRYIGKSSTSLAKQYYEETEAPLSRYPVYSNLQFYAQSNLIPYSAPADIVNLGSGTDTDDVGQTLIGSFYGKTSTIGVVKKFVKLPLVPIPTDAGQSFQAPNCIQVVSATSFTAGETIVGHSSGGRVTIVAVNSTLVFYQYILGIHTELQAGETITGQQSGLTATVSVASVNCPLSNVLKQIISYDFGDGSYNYQLKKTDGSSIVQGDGSWILDTYSGVLTFYATLPTNVSASSPPNITCYVYVGKLGLNTSHTIDGKVGIATDYPQVTFEIDSTDAMKLPVGTTGQRPVNAQEGYLRWNSSKPAIEYYDGTNWISPSTVTALIVNTVTGTIDGTFSAGFVISSILQCVTLTCTYLHVTGNVDIDGTISAANASIANTFVVGGSLSAQSGSVTKGLTVGQGVSAQSGSFSGNVTSGAAVNAVNINASQTVTAQTGSFTNIYAVNGTFTNNVNVLGTIAADFGSITQNLLIGGTVNSSDVLASNNVSAVCTVSGLVGSFTYLFGSQGSFSDSLSVGGTLSGSYGSFSSSLTANSFAAASGSISSLTGSYGSFAGSLTSNSIAANTGSIGILIGSYGSFAGSLTSNSIAANTGSIGILIGSYGSFAGSLTSNSIAATTGSISNLIGSYGSFSSSLTTNSIAANTGSISSLTGIVGSFSSSLTSNSIAATLGSISSLTSNSIAANMGSISNLIGSYGSFSSSLTANCIAANAGSISSLTGIFGSFSSSLTANSIAANFGSIRSLTGSYGDFGSLTSDMFDTMYASVTNDIIAGGSVSGQSGNFTNLVASSGTFTGTLSILGELDVSNLHIGNADFGTFTANLASISGQVYTGTLLAQTASLSGDAEIGGNENVAGTVSTSALLVAGSGAVNGNLLVMGTVQGHIGSPTTQVDYSDGFLGPNYASLAASDWLSDAFLEVNRKLTDTYAPPDLPDASGSILHAAWDVDIVLADPLHTACIATSTLTVNNLVASTRPSTVVFQNLYDARNGTLTAYLSDNGTEGPVGSIVTNTLALAATATNAFLTVSNKRDFYESYPDQQGTWYGLDAQLTPPSDLALGTNLYGYRLSHTRTGTSRETTFYVDDSTAPVITTSPSIAFGTQTSWISGVLTYGTDTTVTVTCTISNAIQSFYNSAHGLARLTGSEIAAADENIRPGRDVSLYTPASTQTFALSTAFLPSTYSENCDFALTAYNALAATVSTSIAATFPVRVDTTSVKVSNQVTSGSGDFPAVVGVDFGSSYDHSVSLASNSELQLIDGKYRVPAATNYSATLPPGSPDYTTVNSIDWRYVTFSFALSQLTSNFVLFFQGMEGDGWGGHGNLASDTQIYVRVVDAASGNDTNWLDANDYYDGSIPQANGDGCLLANQSTAAYKSVTLAYGTSGTLYVRVGLATTNLYEKAFSNVILAPSWCEVQLQNLADKTLVLQDESYTAYLAGTNILVDNILINHRPSTRLLYNIFNGAAGILSAQVSFNNGSWVPYGSIDLAAAPLGLGTTSQYLTVVDKRDYYADVPENAGTVFCVDAYIHPDSDLAASMNPYGYLLEHSLTGSTTPLFFYVDNPTTPSISGMNISVSGPTRYVSGVLSYTTAATVTFSFMVNNAVSYFYNEQHGLASVAGDGVVPVDERTIPGRDTSSFMEHATHHVSISTTFADACYQEDIEYTATAYNSIGTYTSYSYVSTSWNGYPTRVDTKSVAVDNQVTSGMGQFPQILGTDFGLRYDHTQSLLDNQELQLVGGKYMVPLDIDYSARVPGSVDYSTVNNTYAYRYVTFETYLPDLTCDIAVRIHGATGTGLGDNTTAPVGMQLYVRVVDDIGPLIYNTGDSGWLDATAFFCGDVPMEDGDPALFAPNTTPTRKCVTFVQPRRGQCFVRLGLQCQAGASGTVSNIAFTRLSVHPWNSNDFRLETPMIPAFIAGSAQTITDLALTTQPLTTACTLPVGPVSDVTALLVLGTVQTILGTVNSSGIELAGFAVSDSLVVIDKQNMPLCEFRDHFLGHSSAVWMCTPDERPGSDEYGEVTLLSACIRLQTDLPPSIDEYTYVLDVPGATSIADCVVATSLSVPFRIDIAGSPYFLSDPKLSLVGGTQCNSGVWAYTDATTLSAVVSVGRAVSNYYNFEHGLARIAGTGVAIADEKNQASRDPSTYAANSPATFTLTTTLQATYTENITFDVLTYNCFGSFTEWKTGMYSSATARLDWSDVPAHLVTSGVGLFPQTLSVDFGLAYSNTQSLLLNSELQFVGGKFQVPAAVDYSTCFPQGSPDYTLVNASITTRYATFEFDIPTELTHTIVAFHGLEGSSWGSQDVSATGASLQVRAICNTGPFLSPLGLDTGWLDANSFFTGIGVPSTDGDPCLLVQGTTESQKVISFGQTVWGKIYVRVGLDTASDKKFSSVSLHKTPDELSGLNSHTLCLDAAVASGLGCIFGSTVTCLAVADRSPTFKQLTGVLDGSKGILASTLQQGTVSTVHGRLNVQLVSEGLSGTTSGYFTVDDKETVVKYTGDCNTASLTYLDITPSITDSLIPGTVPYTLQLNHSTTGVTTPFTFCVDNPLTPGLVGTVSLSAGGTSRVIDGVPSFYIGSSITASFTVTHAVSYLYNDVYGLASMAAPAFNTAYERDIAARPVSTYLRGQAVPVTLVAYPKTSAVSHVTDSIIVSAYNSVGVATAYSINTYVLVDTISVLPINRVTSGTGVYPNVAGTDFGATYTWTDQLSTNSELQYAGGGFSVPALLDYSTYLPAGPDNTNLNVNSRYATFVFTIPQAVSHAAIVLENAQGSGWGNGSDVYQGASVHVRAIDSDQGVDTRWLDANLSYDGEYALDSDGLGCLLCDHNTRSFRNITFGTGVSGTLFVRIGVTDSTLSFSGVSVDWNH